MSHALVTNPEKFSLWSMTHILFSFSGVYLAEFRKRIAFLPTKDDWAPESSGALVIRGVITVEYLVWKGFYQLTDPEHIYMCSDCQRQDF